MTIFETTSFDSRSMFHGRAAAEQAAAVIRKRCGGSIPLPVCGIVLGSGLGGLAELIEGATRIPFPDIPGFPATSVSGHAGRVIVGTLGGQPVVALAGRVHLYEGHDPALAGFAVRVLHALGAPILIASNAAGGVRRTLLPGDLMAIADHVNLMFRSPLTGLVESGDERFPDMSDPYDPALRALLHDTARSIAVPLHDGVYCGLLGPTYETPAEVRMLERFGVDAVGMSTVPEVIVARALGMRVTAISCITNQAAGISPTLLHHGEVLETGKAVAARFEGLIRAFVARLP